MKKIQLTSKFNNIGYGRVYLHCMYDIYIVYET